MEGGNGANRTQTVYTVWYCERSVLQTAHFTAFLRGRRVRGNQTYAMAPIALSSAHTLKNCIAAYYELGQQLVDPVFA